MIAGKSTISAPTAYMPMPASTVASSAILMSATRMPSIITSSIDHSSKMMRPAQHLADPVRRRRPPRGEQQRQHEHDVLPGANTAQNATITRRDLLALTHISYAPPMIVVHACARRPRDPSAVPFGDDENDRGGDREGEGQVARTGRPARENVAAPGAARLRAPRQRGNALEQIAIGAGNRFHGRLAAALTTDSTHRYPVPHGASWPLNHSSILMTMPSAPRERANPSRFAFK